MKMLRSVLFLSGILAIVAVGNAAAPRADTPPATIRNQFLAARDLQQQGEAEQAIQRYQALIETAPGLLAAYNNLAVIYASQGKLDAAREVLQRGIRARPEFATLYDNLNAVFLELSRKDYGHALRLEVKPRKVRLSSMPYPHAPSSVASVTSQGAEETIATAQPAEVPMTDDVMRQTISDTIEGWASAWSAQEVELYLSFYAKGFVPPGGLSRSAWEKQRRQRLSRPKWVKVRLKEIEVEPGDKGMARVRFLQEYRSDSYTDRTRKELDLLLSEQGWRIVAEKSL